MTAIKETPVLKIKGEQIGQTVSDLISDFLKENITRRDRATLAKKTTVGTSTLRNIMYQETTINEGNLEAFHAMFEFAVEKAESSIATDTETLNKIKELFESDHE